MVSSPLSNESGIAEVVWEDPPASARGNEPVDVSPILAALMEQPGKWARVHTGGGSGTSRRAAMLRKAGCVTKTTRVGDSDGRRILFAKYVGEHDAS